MAGKATLEDGALDGEKVAQNGSKLNTQDHLAAAQEMLQYINNSATQFHAVGGFFPSFEACHAMIRLHLHAEMRLAPMFRTTLHHQASLSLTQCLSPSRASLYWTKQFI